jgi:hypothetical protein
LPASSITQALDANRRWLDAAVTQWLLLWPVSYSAAQLPSEAAGSAARCFAGKHRCPTLHFASVQVEFAILHSAFAANRCYTIAPLNSEINVQVFLEEPQFLQVNLNQIDS